MGFLTTITIRNDFLGTIEKDPIRFTKEVVDLCKRLKGDPEKYYGSYIIPQFARHADDHTIFVHMGNTVVNMNPYDKETLEMLKSHPDFSEKIIKHMEEDVKKLKKELKKSNIGV